MKKEICREETEEKKNIYIDQETYNSGWQWFWWYANLKLKEFEESNWSWMTILKIGKITTYGMRKLTGWSLSFKKSTSYSFH